MNDAAAQQAYRRLAKESLSMQTVHNYTNEELSLESLEQTFSSELAQASQWYMALAADEKRLVSKGVMWMSRSRCATTKSRNSDRPDNPRCGRGCWSMAARF